MSNTLTSRRGFLKLAAGGAILGVAGCATTGGAPVAPAQTFANPQQHWQAARQQMAAIGVTREAILAPIETGYVLTARSDRRGSVGQGEYRNFRKVRDALVGMGYTQAAPGYRVPRGPKFGAGGAREELGTALLHFVKNNADTLGRMGVDISQQDLADTNICTCGTTDLFNVGSVELGQQIGSGDRARYFKNRALVDLLERIEDERDGRAPSVVSSFFVDNARQPATPAPAYGRAPTAPAAG